MQCNTITTILKCHFQAKFYQFHTSTESKYSQLFKNTLQCLTSCGAPLCFHSIHCRSVSWCIYDNYPLTHLLDLVHHSLRITGGVRRTETYGSITCALWSLLSVVCHHVFLTCSPGKRDWPTPWTETAACPDCCWGLPAPQWGKPPCSSGWTLSEPATVFWSHSSPLKSRPTGPAADSGPGSLKLCPLRSSPPPSLQQQYNVKREAHTCSFL